MTDTVWEKIVPGGDCACADGSEFNFWVRQADPTKVVLFLEGGGACFDPTTCSFVDSTTYDWNISPDDDPALMSGIFDFSNPENPLADYSFVYVPYCTGDVHLGNLTHEYSPELTVEHVGMVNGTAALTYLGENFASAEQVVVVGESAGAVAAPLYGGLVSDLLPDAQVTVYADGAGAYPDEPGINTFANALWGTLESVPDWDVNEGSLRRTGAPPSSGCRPVCTIPRSSCHGSITPTTRCRRVSWNFSARTPPTSVRRSPPGRRRSRRPASFNTALPPPELTIRSSPGTSST